MIRNRIIASVLGTVVSVSLVYGVKVFADSRENFEYLPDGVTVQAKFSEFDANDFATMYSFDQKAVNLKFSNEVVMQSDTTATVFDKANNKSPSYIDSDVLVIPDISDGKINDNYLGRFAIPALGIEDSVYFTGDDYYLKRDYNGNSSSAGELYIDGRCTGNLFKLDNLINGHSMNNGTKFGKLKNIRNQADPVYMYFKEYKTGRVFVYKVFSANLVSNQDTGVYLSFGSYFERNLYYNKMKDSSLFKSSAVDTSNNILTLNTCDYNVKDGHLLVSGVLIGWR